MFPKGETSKQVEEENTAEMIDSQQEAIAVALRGHGQQVPEVIIIAPGRQDGSAARRCCEAGDGSSSVDGVRGRPAPTQLRGAISTHKPGRHASR